MAGEKKTAFIRASVGSVQRVANEVQDWSNLEKEYFANAFNTGIVQADLDPYDLTLTQFQSMITLIQNYEKFKTNQDLTGLQADYESTFSIVLRAPV